MLRTPGLVQPAVASALVNNIATLQDTLSNLERIANTPLPFAYQAHLRMSLWLYLFFLPVCPILFSRLAYSDPYIVPNLELIPLHNYPRNCIRVVPILGLPWDWSRDVRDSIPSTLASADEKKHSENPFNYDLNDLDLDNFCLTIQRELHEITAVCFPVERSDGLFANQIFKAHRTQPIRVCVQRLESTIRTDRPTYSPRAPSRPGI